MSADFRPTHADGRPLVRCTCEDMTCPACRLTLNLNERNWRDLLDYLGLEIRPIGRIAAPRLAELCKRRLAMADVQSAVDSTEGYGRGGCLVITGGRPAGYLRDRAEQLLKIALAAGDAWVSWS